MMTNGIRVHGRSFLTRKFCGRYLRNEGGQKGCRGRLQGVPSLALDCFGLALGAILLLGEGQDSGLQIKTRPRAFVCVLALTHTSIRTMCIIFNRTHSLSFATSCTSITCASFNELMLTCTLVDPPSSRPCAVRATRSAISICVGAVGRDAASASVIVRSADRRFRGRGGPNSIRSMLSMRAAAR